MVETLPKVTYVIQRTHTVKHENGKMATAQKTTTTRKQSSKGKDSLRFGRINVIADRGQELGFFEDKTVQIGGRVNKHLLEEAKKQAGVSSNSEVLDLALASLAINDGFAELVEEVRGTVDKDFDLDFLED